MSPLRRRPSTPLPVELPSDHVENPSDSEDEIIAVAVRKDRAGFNHKVASYLKMLVQAYLTLRRRWTHYNRRIRLFFNPNGVLYSDWEAMALFECWCVQFHKTYPSVEERLYRATVFKESLEWAYRQNQKEKGVSYCPQRWADRTEDELIRMSNFGDDSDSDPDFDQMFR